MKQYANVIFYTLLALSALVSARNTKVMLNSVADEVSDIVFQEDSVGYRWENLNNGNSEILTFPENEKLVEINRFNFVNFAENLTLDTEELILEMKYTDSRVIYEEMDQWTMVALDDFQGSSMNWSRDKLSTCGTNDNMFLGGHCNFGGEDVHKNYTMLPPHQMLRITANFHFFDKWEGEEAFMYVNDIPVWTDSYNWCPLPFLWYCRKYAINACGLEYPDRLSVPIDFSTMHNETEFTLAFGAFHNKTACEASWGIDDVTIYVK